MLFWPFPQQVEVIKSRSSWQTAHHSVPFLFPDPVNQTFVSLFFAGFSVVIRPTAGLFWGILAIRFLLGNHLHVSKLCFLKACITMGCLWIGFSVGIDRIVLGEWIFVPWNFIQFNVLRGVGNFYGVHPFYWYIVSALPVILLSLLPVFAYGIIQLMSSQVLFDQQSSNVSNQVGRRVLYFHSAGQILIAIFGLIGILSVLGHKEFRFLFPVVPLMMIVCGFGISVFLYPYEVNLKGVKSKSSFNWRHLFVIGIFIANLPMLVYFSRMHQVGTIHALEFLQSQPTVESVYFLLPCHQTPYFSFIHRNITLGFPDCSPPVGKDPSIENHRTETSEMLSDPLQFVNTVFYPSKEINRPDWFRSKREFPLELPSHFVVYETTANQLDVFFKEHQYDHTETFHHTYSPMDDIQSDVWIFERNKSNVL